MLCATTAAAQPAKQPAAQPAPAANEGAEPPFNQPEISDPMLAPPEAAPAELRSWDDAIARLRHAPDYLTSVQNVERALAQRRIALAAVLPTLTAQGSYTHNFNTLAIPLGDMVLEEPPATVFQASGTLAWNVLNPRGLYGVGTADLNVEVARLSLADRRRVLASAAVSAMLSTLAAARVTEIDRVSLRSALERLALTQTRLKFARGTELDVDRAQQDVASARAQVISGDEQLRQAREALGQALGSATPIATTADLELAGFEHAIAQSCRLDKTVEQRADIVAARARVSLAERQITDAKLLFAPYAGVTGQAAYSTTPALGPKDTYVIAATVTLPLYDGGVRYGALRDASAAAEQARQELESLRIAALVETARAARAVGVNQAARDVAKQQRDLAARVDERTREGYAKGLGTSLDLVTSAQALRQADLNLAVLDCQLAQARAGAVLVNAECMF
ncbi:MAG TPA: TolC family protein [Kofleriaceae bacterium]|nr:TolC family protein [Kofleriaceae bacterium]